MSRPKKRTRLATTSQNALSLQSLHTTLDSLSEPSYKVWHESYMRGVTPARGVKMAGIRRAVREWCDAGSFATSTRPEQLQIALSLFRGKYTEDKLSGILILAEFLSSAVSAEDLPGIATLFEDELIADWNICDWLAVKALSKVVSPCIVDAEAQERAIGIFEGWVRSKYVWQARAGLLAQLNLACNASDRERIAALCQTILQREERFAKTAVGWMLAECDKHDRDYVAAFIAQHIEKFDLESLKKATKRFPASKQKNLIKEFRATCRPR